MVAGSVSGPVVPCFGWLALLNSTSLMSGFPSRWIWLYVLGVDGPLLSSLHAAVPRPASSARRPSAACRMERVEMMRMRVSSQVVVRVSG